MEVFLGSANDNFSFSLLNDRRTILSGSKYFVERGGGEGLYDFLFGGGSTDNDTLKSFGEVTTPVTPGSASRLDTGRNRLSQE